MKPPLNKMGEGFAWSGFEEVTLGGLSGLKMSYSVSVAGIQMEYIQYMVGRDNTVYTLTATLAGGDETAKSAVAASLESFKLR